MKKLNILLLSVVAACSLFVSCTKDEANSANNNGQNNDISGQTITMTGKWNFSTIAENSDAPYSYTAGWSQPATQCAGIPDYIEFTSASTGNYGNAETSNGNCNVTKTPMTYTTAASQIASTSTVTINNMGGTGRTATFYILKNTTTELTLKTQFQGSTYTYFLTKAN